MTDQKKLKRAVRARSAKTGESYTLVEVRRAQWKAALDGLRRHLAG